MAVWVSTGGEKQKSLILHVQDTESLDRYPKMAVCNQPCSAAGLLDKEVRLVALPTHPDAQI